MHISGKLFTTALRRIIDGLNAFDKFTVNNTVIFVSVMWNELCVYSNSSFAQLSKTYK